MVIDPMKNIGKELSENKIMKLKNKSKNKALKKKEALEAALEQIKAAKEEDLMAQEVTNEEEDENMEKEEVAVTEQRKNAFVKGPELKKRLKSENAFITDVLSFLHIPKHKNKFAEDEDSENEGIIFV